MRILSLDVGKKRIGVAISDALGITAQGLETLVRKNKKDDLAQIKKVTRDMSVSKIIVGLPLNMDGTKGPMAKDIYSFVKELRRKSRFRLSSGTKDLPRWRRSVFCWRPT